MPEPQPTSVCFRCHGADPNCGLCGGSGRRYDSLEGLGRSAQPFDLVGALAIIAWVAAGLVAIGTFVVPITWWMGAGGVVRWILEHSPLTFAVAKHESDSGRPIVVGIFFGLIVLAALVLVSVWRRRLAARAVAGEVPFAAVLGTSLLRTLLLVFGLTFVPVASSIAAGNDLGPDSDPTVLMGVWPIAIVLLGVTVITLSSNGRRWEAAVSDAASHAEAPVPEAPPVGPPPPDPGSRLPLGEEMPGGALQPTPRAAPPSPESRITF